MCNFGMTVLRVVKALDRKQQKMKINRPLKEIRRNLTKAKAKLQMKNLKDSKIDP